MYLNQFCARLIRLRECFILNHKYFLTKSSSCFSWAFILILFSGGSLFSTDGQAKENNWYLYGQMGHASTDFKADAVKNELVAQSVNYENLSVKDTDVGYQLGFGCQLDSIFSVQLGYLDFGDRNFRLTGEVTDLDNFHDVMQGTYPESAKGPHLVVLASWPLTNDLSLTGKLGYLDWQQDYQYQINTSDVFKAKRSGNSVTFGGEISYSIFENTLLFLSYDQARLDDYSTSMFSIGAKYQFN